MSLDLKIERFGLELFNRLFSDYEIVGFFPQPLPDIYAEEESELNEDIVRAVKVFMGFFHSHYADMYDVAYGKFKSNQMDFVKILMDTFPHHQLLDDGILQFVASCAFVAELCLIGLKTPKGYRFLWSAHLMWAMFVDLKLKDYFYELGGWDELRKAAYSFRSLYGFLKDYNETSKNFLFFKYERVVRSVGGMTAFCQQVKSDGDPLALQWADHVTHGQHPPFDPKKVDIKHLEDCLMELRLFVDPHEVQDYLATNVPARAAEIGMSGKDCLDALANSTVDKHHELFNMVDVLYSELKQKNELNWKDFYKNYLPSPDPSTVVLSAQDGVINVDHISSGITIDKPLVTDTVNSPQLPESHFINKPPRDSEHSNTDTLNIQIINPDDIKEQYSHVASAKVASRVSDRPQDTQQEAVVDHREKLMSEFQKSFPRLMSTMVPGSLPNNNDVEENSRTNNPNTSFTL